MRSMSRISAYHRTRGGLLIFGLTELLLAFVLTGAALWTTYNGGWWAYLPASLAAICLFGFVQNGVRLAALLARRAPAARKLPRKYLLAVVSGAIFLIIAPGLIINFLWSTGMPAIMFPTKYYDCPAGTMSECVCFGGPAYDTAPYDKPQGFPFVVKQGVLDCTPPSGVASWLDAAAAALIAALIAAGTATGGRLALERVRHGRR